MANQVLVTNTSSKDFKITFRAGETVELVSQEELGLEVVVKGGKGTGEKRSASIKYTAEQLKELSNEDVRREKTNSGSVLYKKVLKLKKDGLDEEAIKAATTIEQQRYDLVLAEIEERGINGKVLKNFGKDKEIAVAEREEAVDGDEDDEDDSEFEA